MAGVDRVLVDAAVAQMRRRWRLDQGGGAAALAVAGGQILTSVGLDNVNDAVRLCHETGAMCQAYTLGLAVTASVCVARESGTGRVVVLAPCGVCRERLALWGPDVQVGVPDPDDPARWQSVRLGDIHRSYWPLPYYGGRWPAGDEHRG